MTQSSEDHGRRRPFDSSTLELPKVLEMLASQTSFSAGREAARHLEPATDLSEVRRRQRETSEARELQSLQPTLGFGGAHDIRPLLERAGLGGILQPHELLDVASTIKVARQWRSAFSRLRERLPTLAETTDLIRGHDHITSAIEEAINDAAEISDHASPRLREVRGQRRVAQERLTSRLQAMLANSNIREALQDAIITQRNGRYVLPVRAEMRARVRGIVHDQSSTGVTLFIEPLDLVDVGNRVRELDLEERTEIERILRALSVQVAGARVDLTTTVECLATLDVARAKARLGQNMRAVEPIIDGRGRTRPRLNLIRARHPMLGEQAVPSSLELGGEFDTLVITGPNTGGKTVALKTVGLLSLMAQSGLHIPADEGSVLPVFERVYADIGDEQSIEQSLSTFSAHVANIIRMFKDLTPPALVLMDELGAGTDPVEGAALARALLDKLRRPGILTIATTHYSELKTYANETERVSNASVEFDVDSLRPTYRLQIGLPGQSNALAIARRLGMPTDVLDSAESWLGPQALHMEQLLEEIKIERQQLAGERAEAERERRIAERARMEAEESLAEAERLESEAYAEAAATAERELETMRREADRLLTRARQMGATAPEVEQAVAEIKTIRPPRPPKPRRIPPPVQGPALRVGGSARVRTLGAVGTVRALHDDGQAEVDVSGMRVRTRIRDLEPVPQSQRPRDTIRVSASARSSLTVPTELHLRGLRVDEALEQLDRYVHDAAMAGVPRVRIVHGKGTGAVRRAVWDALAKHSLARNYELAAPAEGGSGVTVVDVATV